MSAVGSGAERIDAEIVWHDVECGAYAADLALWNELAREAAGPVLELGAGTGRVALRLARAGLDVTAVDSSAELIGELRRRARESGVDLAAEVADARRLSLGRRFAAILAPMQVVHLFGGPGGRADALAACASHLEPGGVLAAALLAEEAVAEVEPGDAEAADARPLPDVRELDGWVYSSLPVDVRVGEGAIEVRRLRQLVSPAGELSERTSSITLDRVSPDRFEAEAADAGFASRERISIPSTDDHVGSVVCVLEASR